MGAEESKPRKPNQPTQQNVSRDEVKQLLEQQKKEYERKLKELQIRTNVLHSNQPVEAARDVTPRNADQILGQQLQEFAQIAYNAAPSTSGTQRLATKPNIKSPNSVDPSTTQNARRSQYSYTSDELRNIQSAQAKEQKQQLYPQLNTLNQRVHVFSEPTNTCATPVNLKPGTASPSASDFVVVNKNQNANQSCITKPGPSFAPGAPGSSDHISRTIPILVDSSTSRNQNCVTKPGPSFARGTPSPSSHQPSTSRAQPSAPPQSAVFSPSTSKSPFSKPQANKKKGSNFDCITCGNQFGLNIYQCSLGHSSCRNCKLQSEPCGICRKDIGDVRNIALEALVAEAKLQETVDKAEAKQGQKCPNHAEGCNYYCKTDIMNKHLKDCPYREFSCPLHTLFGQCNWRGRLSQMAAHFSAVHPENCQGNVDTEMYMINVVDSNHNVYFIELSPYNFLVHLKVDENERKVFMTVQLLGTRVSASKWTYEIQVYNKREPRRKYAHTDICHSDTVPVQEIFNEMKCATLPLAYALSFINEGCLTYKFYIRKGEDDFSFKGKFRGRGRGRGRGAKGNIAN